MRRRPNSFKLLEYVPKVPGLWWKAGPYGWDKRLVSRPQCRLSFPVGREPSQYPQAQAVQIDVDDGRGVKRERLADDQTANNRDAQGTAEFRARPGAECERQTSQKRRHCGHDDRAEAQHAGLEN